MERTVLGIAGQVGERTYRVVEATLSCECERAAGAEATEAPMRRQVSYHQQLAARTTKESACRTCTYVLATTGAAARGEGSRGKSVRGGMRDGDAFWPVFAPPSCLRRRREWRTARARSEWSRAGKRSWFVRHPSTPLSLLVMLMLRRM